MTEPKIEQQPQPTSPISLSPARLMVKRSKASFKINKSMIQMSLPGQKRCKIRSLLRLLLVNRFL